MHVRHVSLNGGPYDGTKSVASHDTAIVQGEIYVWDGGEDRDRFAHALSEIQKLPSEQRANELKAVHAFVLSAERIPIEIPTWRINAWIRLIQYGSVDTDKAPPCYPPIEECIRVIAAKSNAPVNVIAAALIVQSQELGVSAEELGWLTRRSRAPSARHPPKDRARNRRTPSMLSSASKTSKARDSFRTC